jgi:hypothetical protein
VQTAHVTVKYNGAVKRGKVKMILADEYRPEITAPDEHLQMMVGAAMPDSQKFLTFLDGNLNVYDPVLRVDKVDSIGAAGHAYVKDGQKLLKPCSDPWLRCDASGEGGFSFRVSDAFREYCVGDASGLKKGENQVTIVAWECRGNMTEKEITVILS